MKANSYDEYAEQWAQGIRSGKNLAHDYLEKPAMYGQLPNLKGKKVLCLGCGSGEECRYLADKGADVVGVDLSKELIRIAKESYPDIQFFVSDIEKLDFENESFDFVYSSLVMHYKEDWVPSLKEIRRVMKEGAEFLFSTHHPVLWGASTERKEDYKAKLMGYRRSGTEPSEILGDYLNTYNKKDLWFDAMEVSYFHKPLSAILSNIRAAQLEVVDFIEPKAVEAVRGIDENFYNIHQKLPLFMIFKLAKVKK